jgi:hypothetical protein
LAGALGAGKHPLEVGAGEFGHGRTGNWPVEGDDPALPIQSDEQGGDVRKANDGLGMTAECRIIHSLQQAHGAVAASYAPNCIYVGVIQSAVQIAEPFLVRTGEVSQATVGILA